MPDNCLQHAGGKDSPGILCVVCQANKNAERDYSWPGIVFVRPVHLIGDMDGQYALLGDPISSIVPQKGLYTPHLWRACIHAQGVYVDVVTNRQIPEKLVKPAHVCPLFPFENQTAIKNVWQQKNSAVASRNEFGILDDNEFQMPRPLPEIQRDFEGMKQIALVPAPQEVGCTEVYV
jgi:hypothetical protein